MRILTLQHFKYTFCHFYYLFKYNNIHISFVVSSVLSLSYMLPMSRTVFVWWSIELSLCVKRGVLTVSAESRFDADYVMFSKSSVAADIWGNLLLRRNFFVWWGVVMRNVYDVCCRVYIVFHKIYKNIFPRPIFCILLLFDDIKQISGSDLRWKFERLGKFSKMSVQWAWKTNWKYFIVRSYMFLYRGHLLFFFMIHIWGFELYTASYLICVSTRWVSCEYSSIQH